MTTPRLDAGHADAASRSADAIVPRIKHLAFERALEQAGVPPTQRPLIEPLAGELIVTYAFNLPDRFVMATAAQIEAAGLSAARVRDRAVANLRAGMRRDGLSVQFRQRASVYLAECGGELEACLLLVDDLWSHVEQEFGAGIIAAAPRRDRLLFACRPDAAALAALLEGAAASLREGDDVHALSGQLIERVAGGWRARSA